jgi:hypothetical protein
MERLLKIGLIIAFLSCLLDMPYGYFMLVRFVGMIGFGLLAIEAKNKGDNIMFLIFTVSAILINPIVKIPLGRSLWNALDVIWAITIGTTLDNNKRN